MSAKNDLNAIYKLEFYKKKKNWKLKRDLDPEIDQEPQQEVEVEKPTVNNDDLNKTYAIGRRVHTDGLIELNNAFLQVAVELSANQNTLEDYETEDYEETNIGDVNKEIIWAKPELPWDQTGANFTQQGSSDSLESLTSFMQGASCAPHSSDIDVTSSTDEDLCHFAWCLSLQNEESLLKHLLVRATGRERRPHHSRSYDDPRVPGASHPELILAGSFNLNEIPGKGRGRLRTRPGVVALRMGRPFVNQ